jgi:hypothetical protein
LVKKKAFSLSAVDRFYRKHVKAPLLWMLSQNAHQQPRPAPSPVTQPSIQGCKSGDTIPKKPAGKPKEKN